MRLPLLLLPLAHGWTQQPRTHTALLSHKEGIGVGIDLGTTNSCLAQLENGIPVIISTCDGRTTPSIVSFSTNPPLVGKAALPFFLSHPYQTYRNAKRSIGLGSNPSLPLSERLEDARSNPIRLGDKLPEEISARVISYLLENVKATRAVVGVPAYFDDAQREATQRAVEASGIEKVKLLREPEAAALAYGIRGEEEGLVICFDLGGGTYDVSVLEVGGGVVEVVATGGDAALGGCDFDERIGKWMARQVGIKAFDATSRCAEAVRIRLSRDNEVNLALPVTKTAWEQAGDVLLENGQIPPPDTHLCTLTRSAMEVLCKKEIHALSRPLREVAILAGALLPGDAAPGAIPYTKPKSLKKQQQQGRKRARDLATKEKAFRKEKRDAGDSTQKVLDGIHGRPIQKVVLVGGATKMPVVRRLIRTITGIDPMRSVDPDEAVALGCAVQVGLLDGEDVQNTVEVMNPMKAAILRALAEKNGITEDQLDADFD